MGHASIAVAVAILAAGVIATTLLAAAGAPGALLATTAAVGVVWTALAVRERRTLQAAAASQSKVSAVTAQYMALVWAWGALAIIATYVFVLAWREWWQFALAFAVAGALCLGLAEMLERDAKRGRDDATMLSLARYLGIGQLAGMVIAVIGLLIDPDKEFLWPNEDDWAANIVFLGGALTLAAITLHALLTDRNPGAKAST